MCRRHLASLKGMTAPRKKPIIAVGAVDALIRTSKDLHPLDCECDDCWTLYHSDPAPNKAQHSPQGLYIHDIEVANYCDKLKAHADKLAEALRDILSVNLDKELKAVIGTNPVNVGRVALAAYESEAQ